MLDNRLSYDEAVQFLQEHPEKIYSTWCNPYTHKAGRLFDYLTANRGKLYWEQDGQSYQCGCLTQLKGGDDCYRIPQEELLQQIREDPRIPIQGEDITVEHLEVFKEYQELADKLIRNWRGKNG